MGADLLGLLPHKLGTHEPVATPSRSFPAVDADWGGAPRPGGVRRASARRQQPMAPPHPGNVARSINVGADMPVLTMCWLASQTGSAKEVVMPAVTVEDILVLPRISEPDQ